MEDIYLFRKELQNLGYCETVTNTYPRQIRVFLEFIKKENTAIKSEDILNYYNHIKTVKGKRTKKPFPNTRPATEKDFSLQRFNHPK
ncbi:MAG: hypothetical protein MUW56_08105 [Chryseobacterium sp.]|uniref:hypothetical protein n=1 Tax=Chryseobacterium sp. TaxID=1871047 RepID=UPI0025B92782|nr:hypothetical protein [Chryseobacterium sp.]MCJ7933588.1 hypothetical protein [Chryseobacterium sp.]